MTLASYLAYQAALSLTWLNKNQRQVFSWQGSNKGPVNKPELTTFYA